MNVSLLDSFRLFEKYIKFKFHVFLKLNEKNPYDYLLTI